MAGSTYSSNLKIELMTTGENSGTWGDITNTNLGTALEQAIVGYGNPDYVADANLTISITNSNAAQAARALVLNVTSVFGSLTATRELVVPTIQKQYIVQNNTTGGQSITVKTSAGTGITVPNGRKAHLYVDGTNVIQMFDFVDINGGTIDGTPIGGSSAAAGAFTTLAASGATSLNGAVNLGDAAGDNITFNGTVTSHLLFTDNTYDIGASGATRPRNLYLAGAATIGGNLSVGGTLTLTGGLTLNGNVTVGDSAADTLTINSTITSNLIFTDNTYDIGASGATRPRNLFLAGNATIGGAQTLTGALTVDSTTNSTSATTGSIQTDGGIGLAKDLYVGGSTTLGDASADTLTINSTVTSHLYFTDNTYDIGGSGVTRPRSLYLAQNAVIGTTLATGGASDGGISLYARNTNLTGTAQYGAYLSIIASSASTSRVTGAFIRNATAAASFTTVYSAGIEIGDATKGAGSTITSQYGLYVNDMTSGTYNYGVVSSVTSGTNKYNIYADGTAQNYFAGIVGIGQAPSAGIQLAVTGPTRIVQSADNSALGGLTSGLYLQRSSNDSRFSIGYTTANGYWNISASYGSTGAYAPLAFATSDTVQAILSTSGQFGVGTAPSYKIHAYTTGSNAAYVAAESTTANINAGFVAKSTAATWIMGTNIGQTGVWELYNGGTKATVDSSANMTLATTTNFGGISRLSVDGIITAGRAASTNGGTLIQNQYSGASNQFVTLIGEEYGTGAVSINYALRNSQTDSGFTSSADNSTWYRAFAKVGGSVALRVGGASTATSTAVGSTQATNEFFRVLYNGSFLINRTTLPSGLTAGTTVLAVGGGASFGGSTSGVQIGSVGDNSAYDGFKMYSLGYNGGSPAFVFTPTTTPGSGVLSSRFMFNNSNGSSTVANNLASVHIEAGLQVGYSAGTASGSTYRVYVHNDANSATIYTNGANHFIASGNEFNFTNSFSSAQDIYFNYRSGGGLNAYVNAYRFMNGNAAYQATYASAFNVVSDYRVKTDVQELDSVLPKVMALRPVNYIKDDRDYREYGLLAHEADEQFHDIVRGKGKDAMDEDGDMHLQSVDYMGLTAILTKAIQEQQAMIEQLKAEVASLKGA